MTKNFPDLAKDANLQIQEVEQTPTKQIHAKAYLKLKKKKTKILKAKRKICNINYTGISIQMMVNFSSEILEAKGVLFFSSERKSCKPQILYMAKLYCKNKNEIKTFSNKRKLKNLSLANLPLKTGQKFFKEK